MAYRDGNPPSSWYEPPEEPETEEEENEEFEPDDSYLEDQYIKAIERDYDRYLNWLYQ